MPQKAQTVKRQLEPYRKGTVITMVIKEIKGYVKKVNKDSGKALVVPMTKSRCSDCGGYCEACSYSRRYERVAVNKIDAEPGDLVMLESNKLNAVRIILWLIPVLIAIGAALSVWSYGLSTALVLGAVALPAGYGALYIAVGKHTFFYTKLTIISKLQ